MLGGLFHAAAFKPVGFHLRPVAVAMTGIADFLGGLGLRRWRGFCGRWFGLNRVGKRVVTSRASFRFGVGERHDVRGNNPDPIAPGEDFRDDFTDQWHRYFGDGEDQSVERLTPDGLLEELQGFASGATLKAAFKDVGFFVVADDVVQFVHVSNLLD